MNNRFIALTDSTLRNFAVFGSQGAAVYLQFLNDFYLFSCNCCILACNS